jgi:hypothetical protein
MTPLSVIKESHPYGVYLFGDAATSAQQRLTRLKRDRQLPIVMRGYDSSSSEAKEAYLDWEPLEILLEVINDPTERSVGGTPQIAKIYQNGLTESFLWRDATGHDSFGGRPVETDERFDRRIISFSKGLVSIAHSDRSAS